MSAGEERVNTESQQQEQAPRTVSATAVLLSARRTCPNKRCIQNE